MWDWLSYTMFLGCGLPIAISLFVAMIHTKSHNYVSVFAGGELFLFASALAVASRVEISLMDGDHHILERIVLAELVAFTGAWALVSGLHTFSSNLDSRVVIVSGASCLGLAAGFGFIVACAHRMEKI